ncbi:class II fructose-bisphosphate aldolase [Eubacteriales bacterium OttesenSCG-928-N14]|nr:class II fructose-bisphosphate aldolase [Eubacteriales bacterium OttesenSCG-928-N14]
MLYSMKELLIHARDNGYGIVAASMQSEGNMKAAIRAAEELNSPIILNHRYDRFDDDFEFYGDLARQRAYRTSVPVAINQDHGGTYEQAIRAIHAGYTGIMVDRSHLPYDENVAQVAELTRIAHAAGVSVESELGTMPWGYESNDTAKAGMTDPGQVADFIKKTGIDCLAVCIGNKHGEYKGDPHIDFDVLAACKEAANGVPLVLHGGSGTGDENLSKACKMGVCKINVGTALRYAGKAAYEQISDNKNHLDWWRAWDKGYQDAIMHHMQVFGSVGKAWTK